MSEAFLADGPLGLEDEGLFARDIDGQLLRMDQVTSDDLSTDVTITIDGQTVTVKKAVPLTDSQGKILRDAEGRPVPRATTIYDAASNLFVKEPGDINPIPILCHQEHLQPVGVCRICVVEIAKVKRGEKQRERKLLPACQHRVEETMEVQTIASPDAAARGRVEASVRVLVELLMADHLQGRPEAQQPYNELAALACRLQLTSPRFQAGKPERPTNMSSPFILVDHDACILCDRCVRACDDVKKNFVIGRSGKGYATHIGFDLDQPMGQSSCVSCGECMISCPTDALTLRAAPQPRVRDATEASGGEVENVTAEELRKSYPIFSGVPYKFLQWNASSVRRRHFDVGDVLCREGKPGSTAFLLISGKYEVSIESSLTQIKTQKSVGRLQAFVGRLKTTLVSSRIAGGPSAGTPGIRNDGGAPLQLGQPVAIRTKDDVILGEMTCLSHYPRSATVRCIEAGEVLEIDRNILYSLQRNRTAREIFDKAYRERVLENHLSNLQLFSGLDEAQRAECIKFLRNRVDLLRVDKGQVIFRQGDRADHFYSVRLGFVKVSQSFSGQERVRDYLGSGSSFGEIGLLSTSVDLSIGQGGAYVPTGVRIATCTALDDVELVRIRGEDFRALLERYPVARDKMIEHAKGLIKQNNESRQSLERPLGEFLEQGLFAAQKLLVLDLDACTRCDECTRACADTHDGVTRLIREGLRYDKFLVASSCRSCLDPYCLVGCPVDSIHRRPRGNDQNSLEIVIESWCIGCGQCAKNCPYGNINMQEIADAASPKAVSIKATTCDLCRDVVSADKDPSCVYACPHNAAFRMSGPDLLKLTSRHG